MNARSYELTDSDGPVATDIGPKPRRLTEDEAREMFDQRARELLGMSGAEFTRKWDAGEIRRTGSVRGSSGLDASAMGRVSRHVVRAS